MARYRVTRTALIFQFKDVEAPEDADDEDIFEASWDVPWREGKVINSEELEVEREL